MGDRITYLIYPEMPPDWTPGPPHCVMPYRFDVTDAGITRTFIPLIEDSQSTKEEKMNYSRGLDPVIEVYKKDVDRTLIRRNLKLSHEERLQNAMELQSFAQELRKAGRRKK